MATRRPLVLLLTVLAAAPASPAAAQHAAHGPPAGAGSDLDSAWTAPIPIHPAALRGTYHRAVATRVPAAQAYFDQGLAFMFAFDLRGASRSFRAASAADPACALCAWGEAWTLGPYLNEPMPAAHMPHAWNAVQRAARAAAAPGVPAVERALIAAMATRYAATWDSAARKPLDSAYARAMGDVARRFPRDLDVATLRAEALMLLEPRRARWDAAAPSVAAIHRTLEGVLRRDVRHPGACHLYIHATESTAAPGKAAACAEYLGTSIPAASHINHMPSHTWNRIGRWGDAVRANLRAWHSDQRASIGEGFPVYPSHNLHMLLFAASMDGQGAIAMQAGKDYGKLVPGGAFYQALTLVRFGRFDEVLALAPLDGEARPIFAGLWTFARGYAHLRAGAPDSAAAALAIVDSLAALPDSLAFRGHPPRHLLGIAGGILRGELARAAGDPAAARAALERAVALEDSLQYDEPEPLPFSPRHWLGALLLETGDPAAAAAVYEADLRTHPANGWSLLGLAQAHRAAGHARDAASAQAAFDQAWARADTWLPGSRF